MEELIFGILRYLILKTKLDYFKEDEATVDDIDATVNGFNTCAVMGGDIPHSPHIPPFSSSEPLGLICNEPPRNNGLWGREWIYPGDRAVRMRDVLAVPWVGVCVPLSLDLSGVLT